MKVINPNNYGGLLFDEKEKQAISKVIDEQMIFRYATNGKSAVDVFEDNLKQIVGVKYALGISNGTAGLITALVGVGVKSGDRVLVSSFTFLATALAVRALGAIPIPLEIDIYDGLNIEDLEIELKKGCKAVIVVHLQGRCYNLKTVKELVHKYGSFLIEDSCQSFASKYHDEYSGTIGDVGVYSFQQFKQITCGEGGAIVTNNQEYYNRMRNYSDMGSERDLFPNWNTNSALMGQNYRMNNLSGSILIEQLKKLDIILDTQKKSRDYILGKINSKRIINSCDPSGDTGMNVLIQLDSYEDFDRVKKMGIDNGIEVRRMWSGVYYDNDLFRREKLTALDLKGKECIKTKKIIDRMAVISIPPILGMHECNQIVEFINKIK